jgi:hypothetical protein
MSSANGTLRGAVIGWALAGLIAIPLLVFFDPLAGWQWQPKNTIYDQMMVSIYVALGAVCLFCIREPLKHAAFLWFIVLSSLFHGLVMLFHSLHLPIHAGHLFGDVWILAGAFALGIPLWIAQQAEKNTSI